MSITIEIDGKRVECDTHAEARKALAKAKREAEKADKIRKIKSDCAYQRSAAAGYSLLDCACAILDENSFRYFTIHTPQDSWFNNYAKPCIESYDRWSIRCETEAGTATLKTNIDVVAIQTTGSGFLRGIKFKDGNNDSYWCSVGVCEDVAAFTSLPKRLGAMIDQAGEAYANKKAERKAVQS